MLLLKLNKPLYEPQCILYSCIYELSVWHDVLFSRFRMAPYTIWCIDKQTGKIFFTYVSKYFSSTEVCIFFTDVTMHTLVDALVVRSTFSVLRVRLSLIPLLYFCLKTRPWQTPYKSFTWIMTHLFDFKHCNIYVFCRRSSGFIPTKKLAKVTIHNLSLRIGISVSLQLLYVTYDYQLLIALRANLLIYQSKQRAVYQHNFQKMKLL